MAMIKESNKINVVKGTKQQIDDNESSIPNNSLMLITDEELTTADIVGLDEELDNKVDENSPITSATKTKITYDSKGLVTNGSDLVKEDIPNIDAEQVIYYDGEEEINVQEFLEKTTSDIIWEEVDYLSVGWLNIEPNVLYRIINAGWFSASSIQCFLNYKAISQEATTQNFYTYGMGVDTYFKFTMIQGASSNGFSYVGSVDDKPVYIHFTVSYPPDQLEYYYMQTTYIFPQARIFKEVIK